MKNLFSKMGWMLPLLTFMFIVSCEKADDTIDFPAEQVAEISFEIANYGASLDEAKGGTAAKDAPGYDVTCSDKDASYVHVKIDGTLYYLDIIPLAGTGNTMQTKVIKLPLGIGVDSKTFTIEEFAVYHDTNGDTNGPNDGDADDVPIFAAPEAGSSVATVWKLEGVTKDFTVEAFAKEKVEMDVICYIPADWENFGFAWFQYGKHEVKEVAFFGDVCTKFHEYWHASGSIYENQTTYEGYDFPAIFEVDLCELVGGVEGPVLTTTSNISTLGEGEPLLVEFVDNLQLLGQEYRAKLYLLQPDGTRHYLGQVDFDEDTYSGTGFGGTDGVWDFSVGDCLNDESDGNYEFPAWIPVPSAGEMRITGPTYSLAGGYAKAQFRGVVDGHAQTIYTTANDERIPIWCADKFDNISSDWYVTNFYSSLDPNLATKLPDYANIPWAALNWLVNNLGNYTDQEIQQAIWKLVGTGGQANALYNAAVAVTSYQPPVGGWAIIICDPQEDQMNSDGNYPDQSTQLAQLMIVRVDP